MRKMKECMPNGYARKIRAWCTFGGKIGSILIGKRTSEKSRRIDDNGEKIVASTKESSELLISASLATHRTAVLTIVTRDPPSPSVSLLRRRRADRWSRGCNTAHCGRKRHRNALLLSGRNGGKSQRQSLLSAHAAAREIRRACILAAMARRCVRAVSAAATCGTSICSTHARPITRESCSLPNTSLLGMLYVCVFDTRRARIYRLMSTGQQRE